jgi:hypothetical protein
MRVQPWRKPPRSVSWVWTRVQRPFEQFEDELDDWLPAEAGAVPRTAITAAAAVSQADRAAGRAGIRVIPFERTTA